MQANYVMEYLNDYNENAKMLVCLNLLFSWKCEHSLYHAYALKVIIFYFSDIYTNYVMESLNNMI